MRSYARELAFVLLCLAAAALGCGSAAAVAPGPVVVDPPPKPRNADVIARAIAKGGGVEALLHSDRLRGHPLGTRISGLKELRDMFEGTGVEPARDLDRAFAVAPTVTSEEYSVVVAEHSLAPERLHAALDVAIARSSPPGSWRDDLGVPAANITVRGRRRVAALVAPNVLVLLPEERALDAKRFIGTGGCPLPIGREAVSASALDPARTLRGTVPMRIPETIRTAQATVVPTPDGGADVHIDAQSTSAEQATADAAALSREIARATTVDLGVVKLRVFEAVELRAEGDHVLGDRHLTATELDRIFTLAEALIPP